MNTIASTSFQHCSDKVRRSDEERWLAANYAPRAVRRRLCALYALHHEIERIPGIVSEPPLGEIRFQWWREALDEILTGKKVRTHPVVEAIAAGEIVSKHTHKLLIDAIGARTRVLYGEEFADIDSLTAWLRRSESYLSVIAATIVGSPSREDRAAIVNAAIAYAVARQGQALAPSLHSQLAEQAATFLAANEALKALPFEMMPAIAHFTLTRSYLTAGRGPSPLAKRLRILTAVATGRI